MSLTVALPACSGWCAADPALHFLQAHAAGRAVLVTGWDLERMVRAAMVAIEAGCSGLQLVSEQRPDDCLERLEVAADLVGMAGLVQAHVERSCHEGADFSALWIEAANAACDWAHRVARPEVVVELGALFHHREPAQSFTHWHAQGASTYIADTIVMRESETDPEDSFPVFAYGVDADTARGLAQYWQQYDVRLQQFERWPNGASWAEFVHQAPQGDWLWFGTVAAWQRLLEC